MNYRERIKALRKENRLTQQEVADLLFVGQRTYADYESGKIRISIESIILLAKKYDVSVDYISGASDKKEAYPQN